MSAGAEILRLAPLALAQDDDGRPLALAQDDDGRPLALAQDDALSISSTARRAWSIAPSRYA
jgi:hypothetical protein